MGSEVRESCSPHSGVGLFATREYAVGDVILREEAPLARLAPRDQDMEEQMIRENLVFPVTKAETNGRNPSRLSLRECIGSLPKVVEDQGPFSEAKFRAAIQAALCFVHLRPMMVNEEEYALLELYHPNLEDDAKLSESEQNIVQIARLALAHLGKLAKPESTLERLVHLEADSGNRLLLRIMLIWACNAFEGGRVYAQISRINHSCNPNAKVVVTDVVKNHNNIPQQSSEAMEIRAATSVHAGDEIYISYLDTLLYADTLTRRNALQRDKFLDCQCVRCQKQADTAASIPCPECHPRLQPGELQLEEDVQYDDDQTVCYVCPVPRDKDHRSWKCARCQWSEEESVLNEKHGTELSKLFKTYRSASNKVINFLQDHETQKLPSVDVDNAEQEEADSVHAERLEQHLRLASSVLGAKHWTTNMLLWIQLDLTLQEFHGRLLDASVNDDDNSTVLETVAECMDQLERICRFFDGLDLHLHRGHWLSDVIVGCARALVSLGDVKSQKFAATTLDKYLGTADIGGSSFVDKFETEGMQKVILTIKDAWKRNSDSNYDDRNTSESPEKRAKR